jgi:YVTN family beta-propeller protein
MISKARRLLSQLAILALALLLSVVRTASAFTVYVSSIDGGVSVIDSTTNAVTTTIPVGGTGITISPDGGSAYVGGYYTGTVSVINIATNVVTDSIPVGVAPWDIAFTPDGKTAYVTDEALNAVWVIDTATRAVVGSAIPLGTSEATEIAITPDGAFVYVVSICGNGPCFAPSAVGTVSIINTTTNTVVKTIPVGYFPNGIAMAPTGAFAYIANQCADVSCFSGGSVSVINTESQAITKIIPTGQFDSQFITIASGGKLAYVANTCGDAPPPCSSGTGTVSTIDPAGHLRLRELERAQPPFA